MSSFISSIASGVTGGTDFTPAALIYTASEVLNWVERLRLPGKQADATKEVLAYQKQQYDEIEARRIGYLTQANNEWCECINNLLLKVEAATDDIPEPAMFQPVSPSGEQWQTISDNLETAPTANALAEYINKKHVEMDIAKQVLFNPDYYKVNEVVMTSIGALIEGDLPKSIVVETFTRAKEKGVKNGRFGRSARQTARDLGMASYRIQKEARRENREEIQFQNSVVSNSSRQFDLRSMMVTPQQRIAYGIQQGQLIQQSLQNAHNACARKAPHLKAELNIALQKCNQMLQLTASKAGLVNSNVPDFATLFQGQSQGITSTFTRGLSDFVDTVGISETATSGATGDFGTPQISNANTQIGSGRQFNGDFGSGKN